MAGFFGTLNDHYILILSIDMYKYFSNLTLLLFLFIGLVECDKDKKDSVSPGQNEFVYDGERYPLSFGVMYDYGYESSTDHTNYDFILSESVEELDEFGDPAGENPNSAYGIYLWLESSGDGVLNDGDYPFSDDFISGNFMYDAEYITSFATGNFIQVTGGEVSVSSSGNQTTLDFTLELANGKEVEGNLTYEFPVFDVSDFEKRIPGKPIEKNRFLRTKN